MSDHWKISNGQFRILVILIFIGPSIVNIPSLVAGEIKQDGWIAVVLGVVVGLLLIWLYTGLGNLFSNMTLIEASEIILGKWIGKIVSIFFIIFLLLNSAALVYIPGSFLVTQVIPETPVVVVNLLFILVVALGVHYGLEVVSRMGEILFPWFLWGFITLVVFAIPMAEIERIQPILENGLKPILKTTLYFESFISLTMVPFLMIFPKYINDINEVKKSFFQGIMIGGTFILIITLINLLVLGSDLTSRYLHPSYSLAKKINLGDIITRIESVESMVWLIALYYKTFLYFFSTVIGISQLLNLKDYRPIVLPLGMIVLVLSTILYPNVIYAGEWDTTTWIPYVLTNGLIIPLLLFIVAKLRKQTLKNR